MNIWDVLHGNIDKNLLRLLDAQAQAEEKGDDVFPCPVCGGDVWWIRLMVGNHLFCHCKRCGMYLRGGNHETM